MPDKAPGADIQKWLTKIAAYESTFKQWESRVTKILDRYKDSRESENGNSTSKFNILWSNVQTLIPAVYARLPKPDVSRRFRDNDPVGRVASLMIERALDFELEHYPDYRSAMENSVFDRFLGGRGVSWVRYEPHFKAAEQGVPEDGVQITDDADDAETQDAPDEEIDYECCPVDYVHWKDFGHVVARTWEEVPAVWRKVYMSRAALVDRFGEELGNEIPLDTKPKESQDKSITASSENSQACIYEIWDKEGKSAIWLSKSLNKIIDEKVDPLNLESFWPCPRPLYATITTDSLVPTPDFSLYQDQARELDTLCNKIDGLIIALQIRGIYDAAVPELARIFSEAGNTDLIPVKNWAAFAEKNGLKGAIDLVDIAPIAMALVESYKAVDQVKNQIYEIMGIADILRGSTEANETATAQKLKGQFGSLRLRAMQSKVIAYATELLQIKAQIICQMFQPETLIQISGASQLSQEDQALIPQALELIKSGPLRNFRIEVSTDSMVQLDEAQEKSDRMEFLNATGTFLDKALPMAQESPQMAPLLIELLKFGVTGFKVGKTIEGMFDATMDKLKEEAANPQPKPNPEMMKIQAQSQMQQQQFQMKAQSDAQSEQGRQQFEQSKLQMQVQMNQHQAQLDAQVEQSKQQAQAAQNQHQNELEAQREQQRMQNDASLQQMKMQFDSQQKQSDIEFNRWKTELENQTKIAVAELQAKTSLKQTAISANSKDETIEYDDNGEAAVRQNVQSLLDTVNANLQNMFDTHTQSHQQLIDNLSRPRQVLRGPDGKVIGVQ